MILTDRETCADEKEGEKKLKMLQVYQKNSFLLSRNSDERLKSKLQNFTLLYKSGDSVK